MGSNCLNVHLITNHFLFIFTEGAHPVRCPFADAYRFQYNNNTGGICRNEDSYVRACASDAKFRFEFRKCDYAAYTYDQGKHCL